MARLLSELQGVQSDHGGYHTETIHLDSANWINVNRPRTGSLVFGWPRLEQLVLKAGYGRNIECSCISAWGVETEECSLSSLNAALLFLGLNVLKLQDGSAARKHKAEGKR